MVTLVSNLRPRPSNWSSPNRTLLRQHHTRRPKMPHGSFHGPAATRTSRRWSSCPSTPSAVKATNTSWTVSWRRSPRPCRAFGTSLSSPGSPRSRIGALRRRA